MTEEPLPEWFIPPTRGWRADDLDRLPPEAPKHIELIDGALIVSAPQTRFHSRVTRRLTNALEAAAPTGLTAWHRMTIWLGPRQRPDPDVVVCVGSDASRATGRTFFRPEEVILVAEVVSEDSAGRDRVAKPPKYAQAGIKHFWRVEDEGAGLAVHVFELEAATRSYVPTHIVRDRLKLDVPFSIDIDVKALAR